MGVKNKIATGKTTSADNIAKFFLVSNLFLMALAKSIANMKTMDKIIPVNAPVELDANKFIKAKIAVTIHKHLANRFFLKKNAAHIKTGKIIEQYKPKQFGLYKVE